jgi:hypothetical protein
MLHAVLFTVTDALCFHISNAGIFVGILWMIFIWFHLPLLLLASLVLTFYIRRLSILRSFFNIIIIIIIIITIIINDDAHLPWSFLVFEFPRGTSQTLLVIVFVHPSTLFPPTDVPLREIHCALILIYSEIK